MYASKQFGVLGVGAVVVDIEHPRQGVLSRCGINVTTVE
jgi:hypothetical protein